MTQRSQSLLDGSVTGPCRELGTGALLVQGDIACEHGDLPGLVAVIEHLTEHVAEPLHCELLALIRAASDPLAVATAWARVKERIERT